MTSSFYWSYSWALDREIDWLTNRSIGKERSCNRASISFPAVIVQPWLERSGCVPGSVERYSLGMDAGYLLLHHAIIFPVVHQQKETGILEMCTTGRYERDGKKSEPSIIFPIQKVGGCYVFLVLFCWPTFWSGKYDGCPSFLFQLLWPLPVSFVLKWKPIGREWRTGNRCASLIHWTFYW